MKSDAVKSAIGSKPPRPPLPEGSLRNVSVETITPEAAEAYLGVNATPNRKLSIAVVQRYKRDIKAGHWRLSGDPIRFDVQGRLIDGQHRLRACVDAKTPFQSFVIRDLPDEVINVLDSGRNRRAGDMLAFRGYSNGPQLAASAKWMLIFKTLSMSNGKETRQVGLMRPSHEEILEIVSRHPGLQESCALADKPNGIRPSLLSAMHYAGKHLLNKEELADAFVQVFVKGEPYYRENDPAIKWREQVLRDAKRDLYATERATVMSAIYVWNHFAAGEPIVSFRPPAVNRIHGLRPDDI